MQRLDRRFVAIAVMAAGFSLASAGSSAEDKPAAALTVFATPDGVFDAYREALAKQEWRSLFQCYTRSQQVHSTFEVYFATETRGDRKEVEEIRKKYGIDDDKVKAAYVALYQKKHGVDLAKLEAEQKLAAEKAAEKAPPPLPVDEELSKETLYRIITDKPGFFDAVMKWLPVHIRPQGIGKLEQLIVKDDTATGRVATTYTYQFVANGIPRKVEEPATIIFEFRKANGGWLIDGQTLETARTKIAPAQRKP